MRINKINLVGDILGGGQKHIMAHSLGAKIFSLFLYIGGHFFVFVGAGTSGAIPMSLVSFAICFAGLFCVVETFFTRGWFDDQTIVLKSFLFGNFHIALDDIIAFEGAHPFLGYTIYRLRDGRKLCLTFESFDEKTDAVLLQREGISPASKKAKKAKGGEKSKEADFKKAIDATILPVLEIRPTPEKNLKPWQSKFGGTPYLPKGFSFPTDKKGKPMYLLAQFNFEEMPEFEPYPQKGILQFYLADTDSMALNHKNPTSQETFRVLYFPEVNQSEYETDFSFLPTKIKRSPFVQQGASWRLDFILGAMTVDVSDYRFDDLIDREDEDLYDVIEEYIESYPNYGHRLGGYPESLGSCDAREMPGGRRFDYLLFQMNSDQGDGILWGDGRCGKFFINSEDLKKRDFSNVLYDWG